MLLAQARFKPARRHVDTLLDLFLCYGDALWSAPEQALKSCSASQHMLLHYRISSNSLPTQLRMLPA